MTILKLLPVAAAGCAVLANINGIKKNFNVIDKVQVVATANVEMEGICDAVSAEFTESNKLPTDNFSKFLVENLRSAKGKDTRDHSKDMWGTPYRLLQVTGGFEVQSAGPDKQWGTDDDIHSRRSLDGLGPVAAQAKVVPRLAPAPATNQPPQVLKASQSPEETERKVIEFQKKRAADGSSIAEYDLGLRYLEGRGVEKNPALGRNLLEKAAAAGHTQAIEKLEQLNRGKN